MKNLWAGVCLSWYGPPAHARLIMRDITDGSAPPGHTFFM